MGCGSGQQAIQEDIQKQEQIYPIKLHQETIAIIGCTHAGTTAAISLRNLNKNVRIIVFEKNPAVAFLNCGIHLVINKTCDDLNKLFYNSPNKMKSLGIDIHECTSIEGVDFKAKQLNAVNLLNQEKSSYQYDKLIISTGSNPVIPPIIQGLDYKNDPVRQLRADYKRILLCKTYQDAQRLIKLSAEKVCIIGSGHIGMELVWSFNSIGSKVTVVDHGHHILAKYFDIEYVNILEQECRKLGIEISSNSKVIKLSENEHQASVLIQRTVEGVVKTLNAEFDYVIICAGFIPNTENIIQWSENTLANMNKIIVVDKQQRTSIENVYAIGDCATCFNKILQKQAYIPLASQAVRQGIIAAYQALNKDLSAVGSNQTYGIQLFDYSLATTGLTYTDAQKTLQHVGRILLSDYLWSGYCEKKVDKVIQKQELNTFFNIGGDTVRNMADQVVESFDIDIEQTEDELVSVILIFNEENNLIIGCQVMGKQDITQIVNTASIAIQMGMTIDELAFSDLGGFDGETKPWGILQMAANTALMQLPDFDNFDDDEYEAKEENQNNQILNDSD
ncbi:NADH_oxidase [Hexamita inflata]|uniref:NADH_oxidase n=1 Tax=Hexamita inflata TaxID=28002 RepID=A0ABP1LPS0_9EUKA